MEFFFTAEIRQYLQSEELSIYAFKKVIEKYSTIFSKNPSFNMIDEFYNLAFQFPKNTTKILDSILPMVDHLSEIKEEFYHKIIEKINSIQNTKENQILLDKLVLMRKKVENKLSKQRK